MYYQSSTRHEPTRRAWWVAGSALAAALLMAILGAAAYTAQSEPDRVPAGDAARAAPDASAAAESDGSPGDAPDAEDPAGDPETSSESDSSPGDTDESSGDTGEPDSDGSEDDEPSGNGDEENEQGTGQRRLVITDDRDALNTFLARWHGEVLASVDPVDADQPGVPAYLVSIDSSVGGESQLTGELRELHSTAQAGMPRVSDDTELGGVVAGGRNDPQAAQQDGSDDSSGSNEGTCGASMILVEMAELAQVAAADMFLDDNNDAGQAFLDLAGELEDESSSTGCMTFDPDDTGKEGKEAE